MTSADRTRVPRRRRLIRTALAVPIVVAIAAAGVLVASPSVRNSVTYQFKSHTGTPPVIAAAAVPSGSEAPPIRLAAAGDVGTGGHAEFRTAAAMDRIEGLVEYDAVLMLGDNVYPSGDPTQLQDKVLDPFTHVLDGPTRLLPVLGNHDVKNGNGDAQAEALGMPGRWYATTIGNTLVVSLDSTRPDDPAQLEWLHDTLAGSNATWKIATLHHPPYSGGYHGSNIGVRESFAPSFERYGVDLVLAGHDHDYQRSEQIAGVTYVVSGAAAKLRDAHLADFSVAAWSIYHFVDIGVWLDRMEIRAIDHDGNIFDEFTLSPNLEVSAG